MGEESVVARVGLWDVGCGCMAVGGLGEGVSMRKSGCVYRSLGWGDCRCRCVTDSAALFM